MLLTRFGTIETEPRHGPNIERYLILPPQKRKLRNFGVYPYKLVEVLNVNRILLLQSLLFYHRWKFYKICAMAWFGIIVLGSQICSYW